MRIILLLLSVGWLGLCYGQRLKQGEINWRLQWIEGKGVATISKKSADLWLIDGHLLAENGEDYVSIFGIIKEIETDHIKVIGSITSKVSYINSGLPCTRDGVFNFKSYNNRRYWRMQEMDNCEGNNVVDYIDLFFQE